MARRKAKRAARNWNGSKWIRQDKRLAIYLRDGMACAYCGSTVEEGASLTLDHVVPHSVGGTNHEANLVTACTRCNCSRGNRTVTAFARAVADYLDHGMSADAIVAHVAKVRRRKLDSYRSEARALIARRGSFADAMRPNGKGTKQA